jgi:hypothetical protein
MPFRKSIAFGRAVNSGPAAAALRHASKGDTIVVWKLDRLARSLKQLIETVEDLDKRGIGFRSLTEAIDTTTSGGRLVFHIFAPWPSSSAALSASAQSQVSERLGRVAPSPAASRHYRRRISRRRKRC